MLLNILVVSEGSNSICLACQEQSYFGKIIRKELKKSFKKRFPQSWKTPKICVNYWDFLDFWSFRRTLKKLISWNKSTTFKKRVQENFKNGLKPLQIFQRFLKSLWSFQKFKIVPQNREAILKRRAILENPWNTQKILNRTRNFKIWTSWSFCKLRVIPKNSTNIQKVWWLTCLAWNA